MNCRECRDELELWVGQSDLPKEMSDHLAGCADCRGYWEELCGLIAIVAEDQDFRVTAEEASAIEAGINRRIKAERTTITSLSWLRYAAVAASVIIVAGIGLTGYRANWFGNRAGTVDTMVVALADTQPGAAAYDLGGLEEEDYTILERAIDLTVQLDDASVLDNLSDEQIEYLESNLDVKGLI